MHVMFSVENILIVKMFTWSVYLEFNNMELDVITLLSSYISISIEQMFNYFLCRISRSVLFITGNEIMISNFLLQIKEKICNRNLLSNMLQFYCWAGITRLSEKLLWHGMKILFNFLRNKEKTNLVSSKFKIHKKVNVIPY